jgi:putative membrane protein insertion efficiency factor
VLKRIVLSPVRFYRRFLSPLKPAPTCRYYPTCSAYAIEAVERRGVVVGMFKAMWRIIRCNPLFSAGYDPVEPADKQAFRLAEEASRLSERAEAQ